MKCQSRIIKEYKSTKADCMWPEDKYGPNEQKGLSICNGDINIRIKAVEEPEWGGHTTELKLEATCIKCKHPWWPGRIQLETDIANWEGWDITSLLEQGANKCV